MLLWCMVSCAIVARVEQNHEERFAEATLAPRLYYAPPYNVRYWEGSRGCPVLLLHGFGGHAIWQWADQVEALGTDHQLIIPDLLWFGGSWAEEPRYGLEHQAEAMLGLLDHVGAAKVDLVGISYGGFIAFNLALRHPERVRRVVLVDSPGPVYTREDEAAAMARLGVTRPADLVVPQHPDGVGRLLELAFERPPPSPGFVERQVFELMYQDKQAEKIALLDHLAANREEVVTSARPLSQPTLLVWGENDQLFPLDVAERLAQWQGARLAILPETRHAPKLEDPEGFNAEVSAFLRCD